MCLGIPGQVVDIVDAEQPWPRSTSTAYAGTSACGCWPTTTCRSVTGCWCTSGSRWPRSTSTRRKLTLDQVQKMGADYVNEIEAFNSSEIA